MAHFKITIGDIFEIRTPTGLAYVQYTHLHPHLGKLVRVLPGLYSRRPKSLKQLAEGPELYFVFFTLDVAAKQGTAIHVEHADVPERLRAFPLMRKRGGVDHSGTTLNWYIGSGDRMSTPADLQAVTNVITLTPEQRSLSIQELWPPNVMIEMLSSGWMPDRDDQVNIAAGVSTVEPSCEQGWRRFEHYLYFERKNDADVAAQRLELDGYDVRVEKEAGGEKWLTKAMTNVPTGSDAVDSFHEYFEGLASDLNGEYDGWSLQVGRKSSIH